MLFRNLAFGLVLWSASSGAALAANDDHIIQPDNVIIKLSGMTPDKDGIGALDQPATIENLLNVSIILRSVTADTVEGKLMKKSTVFGNEIWREIDFLNVRPRTTMVLGNKIKVIFPASAKASQAITFEFGPKGALTIAR